MEKKKFDFEQVRLREASASEILVSRSMAKKNLASSTANRHQAVRSEAIAEIPVSRSKSSSLVTVAISRVADTVEL